MAQADVAGRHLKDGDEKVTTLQERHARVVSVATRIAALLKEAEELMLVELDPAMEDIHDLADGASVDYGSAVGAILPIWLDSDNAAISGARRSAVLARDRMSHGDNGRAAGDYTGAAISKITEHWDDLERGITTGRAAVSVILRGTTSMNNALRQASEFSASSAAALGDYIAQVAGNQA